MITTAISRPIASIAPQQQTNRVAPRFGRLPIKAPLALKIFGDFPGLWRTAILHNQIIYGICITSRVVFARRKTERFENALRDSLGWWNWFIGSSLTQALLTTGVLGIPLWKKLFKAPTQDYRALLLNPRQTGSGFGFHAKRFFTILLNPDKYWWLTSSKQVEQRFHQMEAIMRKQGAKPAEMAHLKKLFTGSVMSRTAIAAFGVLYTFLALGILIPWFNIFMTRHLVQKHKHHDHLQHGDHVHAVPHPQGQPTAKPHQVTYPVANPFYPASQAYFIPSYPMPGYAVPGNLQQAYPPPYIRR